MERALQLLHERVEESAAALAVAEDMDHLVNVYVPCCAVIGWHVRRCFWEGRSRDTGSWAADTLRMCLLLLCGLLGDKVKVSEYARSISIALLSWTPWHDQVPAAAYVEEACEAQLSTLASALKRNPHATGIADVSDMYVLLHPPDTAPHAARHHPVSHALQHALVENVTRYVQQGPCVVTTVNWRSGKTCIAGGATTARPSQLLAPWSVTTTVVHTTFLHALSRVHRGAPLHASVSALCADFLPTRTRASADDYLVALAAIHEEARTRPPPPAPRALVRQLTIRDHTDPPPKRRRGRGLRRVVHSHALAGAGHDLLDSGRSYTGPRLVGIPLE